MKRTVLNCLLLVVCVITAVSCSKDSEKKDIPVTLSATDLSYCGATLNGKLYVSEDVMTYVEFGFEYSASVDMSSLTKLVIKSIGADKKFQGVVTGLREESKYYYRAYMIHTSSGITIYGDVKSFTTTAFKIVPSGQENGYEYVDLGLPSGLKWATCNVGASKPEEYGSYFAWGETVGDPYVAGKKSGYAKSFGWSNYKYCNGSSSAMTKYSTGSSDGTVDNKTTLEPLDDAAHVNWGGSWRMPTSQEIDELLNNCTWTWTTQNGVYGYRVTSNITGYTDKSIFLPTAGWRDYDKLSGVGSYGYYWSSSLDTAYNSDARDLDLNSGDDQGRNSYASRYLGQSVRPVCP